jgi:hypothetical protein
MDELSPLILLHENGYKSLAPSKCRDSSRPVTPDGPATKVVDVKGGHSGIISRVEYRPVSRHQKCSWCPDNATQEAVESQQNPTVISCCCDDPKCIWLSGGEVRAHDRQANLKIVHVERLGT